MAPRAVRNRWTLVALSGVTAAMLGLAFASAPLYRLFCQATGYGGTPQRAEAASGRVVADRPVTVRFNSDVAPDLPWRFQPVERAIALKAGETALAFYRVTNLSDRRTAGTATFNVTPDIVGRYFVKIDCFCFKEQYLAPGETADLPVTFFVDAAIADDRSMDTVQTVTLSYTFFRDRAAEAATPPQAAAAR